MKKFNFKDFTLGCTAIFAYFFTSIIETVPFDIVNININTIPLWLKTSYMIIYEILVIAIILLIFNEKIIKDFKDILNNHKKYYSTCMKYWLIGLGVMLISNTINIFVLGGDLSNNEEAVRELFKINPLYIYLSSVIFAPIVEELVFRQGIRNIVGRNLFFVILSGFIFGGLHVVTSMESLFDLLYIIPYSALGVSFAYMLYKYDNIFVSMGFHFMHNGILIALQFVTLLFA